MRCASLFILLPLLVHAAAILTLDQSVFTVVPGTQFEITGTVQNTQNSTLFETSIGLMGFPENWLTFVAGPGVRLNPMQSLPVHPVTIVVRPNAPVVQIQTGIMLEFLSNTSALAVNTNVAPIEINVVPEPATPLTIGFGLLLLLFAQCRRRPRLPGRA